MSHGLKYNGNAMSFIYTGEDPWWLKYAGKEKISYIKFEDGIDPQFILDNADRYLYNVSTLSMGGIVPGYDGNDRVIPTKTRYGMYAHKKPLYDCTDDEIILLSESRMITKQYEVVPPRKILEIITEMIKAGGWNIQTIFASDRGKRFVVCCEMPGLSTKLNGKDHETIKAYFTFENPYTGTDGWVALFSSVRVVCNNTLSAAKYQARSKGKNDLQLDDEDDASQFEFGENWLSSNHKQFEAKLEMLPQLIDFAKGKFDTQISLYEKWMNRNLPKKDSLLEDLITVTMNRPFNKVSNNVELLQTCWGKTVGFDDVHEVSDVSFWHLYNFATQTGLASYKSQEVTGKEDLIMKPSKTRTDSFINHLEKLYENEDYCTTLEERAKQIKLKAKEDETKKKLAKV